MSRRSRSNRSIIFGALGALLNAETKRFVNDHDPIPMLGQLNARFGDYLTVAYRQSDESAVVIDFGITGLPDA